jgi:CBS domain-containing protein
MLVRELMSPDPIFCTPDTELARVAKLMTENDCGAIPVCTGSHVVGIVTDRDIVTRAFCQSGNPSTLAVSEVMTRNLVVVQADDRVERAVELMEDRHVRRLPVLEEELGLVGMISITDLADHLAERQAGELLREVSEMPRKARLSH